MAEKFNKESTLLDVQQEHLDFSTKTGFHSSLELQKTLK